MGVGESEGVKGVGRWVGACMLIQGSTNLSLCKQDTKTGTMPELISSSIGGFLSLERIFL